MKTFAAAPGEPIIPVPLTVTIPTLLMIETAFTALPAPVSPEETRVPSRVGLEEFLIRTGIFLCAAGCIALGCIIFAPKYDSSRASPKETVRRTLASLTILISGHQPINVRPYPYLIGVESCSENTGGIVGPS